MLFTWTDTTWWITGFDPDMQGYEAENLILCGKIDFSNNKHLWSAFCAEAMDQTECVWTFNSENYVAYFVW